MNLQNPPQAAPQVLVVEDEELLRELLIDMIGELGTTVIAVGTADAGIEVLKQTPIIDLLITDVRMPSRLNGWDLAQAAFALRPDLPIIIMSGFSEHTAPLPPKAVFVRKPWQLNALCELVRARLGKV